MHDSIWKGLSLEGQKGVKKSIEKIPSRPAGLYVWVLFHLKLGLGRVPFFYRSIIINNTRKEMDSPAGEKRGEIGKRRCWIDSNSTL